MKLRRSLPLILGACLILCGLLLFLFFQFRQQSGAARCRQAAAELEAILPERTVGVPGEYSDLTMPALEIDGTDYVALLEIPSFGLTLPVAAVWNSDALADAPARFSGSAYDNTLVIGGFDHTEQFGFCSRIGSGAQVTVTDMTGAEFTYTVSQIGRSGSADSAWLIAGDSDLTLFCHDLYAMEYVAVRCVLAAQ